MEWPRLWRRGGFPRSFLARSEVESMRWRRELIRTYLERDLPSLGLRLPAPALRRFWMMLAHYHGQTWNSSELARSFGIAHTTVQRYLDVLSETFHRAPAPELVREPRQAAGEGTQGLHARPEIREESVAEARAQRFPARGSAVLCA